MLRQFEGMYSPVGGSYCAVHQNRLLFDISINTTISFENQASATQSRSPAILSPFLIANILRRKLDVIGCRSALRLSRSICLTIINS